MITPYLPYPLVSGGQIRTYNLLKNLSSKHQITLASFIRDEQEKNHLGKLKPFCKDVILFKRRRAFSPLNILMAALTPFPFLVSIYFDYSVRKKLKNKLSTEKFDLIHAETFYVMPNIPQTNVPIFLVEQVIEYLVYQRFVESLPIWSLPLRLLLKLDVAKINWWEKYYWKKAKRLAAMSQEDKDFINNYNSNLKVDVVANGVDAQYFAKTKKQSLKVPTVLFVGNFKWLPNRDATKFLVEEIWPKIKSEIKNCKLWIVGRNPPKEIASYQNTDIKVDGSVEDIREAYGKSSVLVAPIRNGRGTKYKILEAMATRTPIIGTDLAVDGIEVKNGKHALVAETTESLAQATIKVLKNKDLGKKLAEAAYILVTEKYNWQIISARLDQIYQKVGKN